MAACGCGGWVNDPSTDLLVSTVSPEIVCQIAAEFLDAHKLECNAMASIVVSARQIALTSGRSRATVTAMRREGFTVIELLVVCAVVGIFLSLLLPAIQACRNAASRMQCKNHLRQIATAATDYEAERNRVPPGNETMADSRTEGVFWFFLLPYVDQSALYHKANISGVYDADNNEVYHEQVNVYRCPLDVSDHGTGVVLDQAQVAWGAGSYAVNALIVADMDASVGYRVILKTSRGNGETLSTIARDGTSNTILVTEKLAVCQDIIWPDGGNAWAYHTLGAQARSLYGAFAIPWDPSAVGADSKFITNPPKDACNSTLASTMHPNRIPAAFADGSVRDISSSVSSHVWWSLVTPNGGEVEASYGQ
ncbi:DUF1559 domain-containing protein [bacterium]|nr:DUF1559 domain-containing protein [bacterium]